ncbi:MAG: RimK family alpha-L-glutamate ligase [Deltaproteobacteria bacterium]|nr:RimK family alpha-L-glutamate ligase [Deltaproteobacteria bacterium]
MTYPKKVIALGSRLRNCPSVITLGIRPNFSDYSEKEARQIKEASKIYYPGTFYAEIFDSMGKNIFPSYHTYKFVQDKIKQTALFNLIGVPHPKTRVYYGKLQKKRIMDLFHFPFIAKIPRGSAMGRGVFLINNKEELMHYCDKTGVAYIQEFLQIERDIRVVIIGKHIAHAYWRINAQGEFRSNIAKGGEISLSPVPKGALDLALSVARKCGWDDVGIDIIAYKDKYYVLEANMKYGKEGFRRAEIDYISLMEQKIKSGEI